MLRRRVPGWSNEDARPVFICGQPRSGTTLLQRLVNSTGVVVVHGEHLGVLKGIAESYFDFIQDSKFHEFCAPEEDGGFKARTLDCLCEAASFPALVNGFTDASVVQSYRDFVYALINRCGIGSRWGFKEIRYCFGEDRVVPFLQSLFPAAQFVFTVRHPIRQVASVLNCRWWNYTPQEAADRWMQQVRYMLRYCREFPNNAVMARYDDLVAKDENTVRELFSLLDLPYRRKQREILFGMEKTGAAPQGRSLTRAFKLMIARRCGSPETRVLYPDL
jgi:Sulfotransferase family